MAVHEAVVPGTRPHLACRQCRDAVGVAGIHRLGPELQALGLAEPGMPSQRRREGLLDRGDRQRQRQPPLRDLDALRRQSTERPASVRRQRQLHLDMAHGLHDHLPGQQESQAMDGVPVEIARQLVAPALELERTVAHAPAPRHHRVAPPGDGGFAVVLALADQLFDPVPADLGDAPAGLRRDVHRQRPVRDRQQRPRRQRNQRAGRHRQSVIGHRAAACGSGRRRRVRVRSP